MWKWRRYAKKAREWARTVAAKGACRRQRLITPGLFDAIDSRPVPWIRFPSRAWLHGVIKKAKRPFHEVCVSSIW